MNGPQIHLLPDGRLHLNHGPIDLICQAWGDDAGIQAAYRRAARRFDGRLGELVAELPALRSRNAALHGPIARVMACAVAPFRPAFITPMAAVAGAVAEAVLAAMVSPAIRRAYVNNGGDIALHLAAGQSLTSAISTSPHRFTIRAEDGVRGIATSGWRGRSFSFGIADSVTVLARTASMADAAATMIANQLDLPGHPAIRRAAANSLASDTDLGDRLVTVGVGALTTTEVARALDRGASAAQAFLSRGLIISAALFLNSDLRTSGVRTLKEPEHA